jgi:AcrR family transcriptional regulator
MPQSETSGPLAAGPSTSAATDTGGGVRQAKKLATRQTLLSAALQLLEQQSLSSLGLREVTREAGIAPAAFYRHFADLGELGVALVEESLGSMHELIRDIRTPEAETEDIMRRTVDLVVGTSAPTARTSASSRANGTAAWPQCARPSPPKLDSFIDELVEDLEIQPEAEGWEADEMRVLARLYVNVIMLTAADLLDAGPDDPDAEQRIIAEALTQLRIVSVGRLHWLADGRGTRRNRLSNLNVPQGPHPEKGTAPRPPTTPRSLPRPLPVPRTRTRPLPSGCPSSRSRPLFRT